MRHVILTVDYEIFGNGAGDVRQHIIDPTERMARICERHETPLTVFVEMEETLAFQQNAPTLRKHLGYDPYEFIRQQLGDLARRGHDLQLHLHPEWHGCKLVNGQWQLNEAKATVDSLFETQAETDAYIAERKAALDEIIAEGKPGRRVTAYRAGAFSAQPGRKLISALARNDFVLDTSVVHGLHRRDQHVHLDYSSAPAGRTMWQVKADVATEHHQGRLWELPIASKPGRRFHQLTLGRLKAKFSRNVPKVQQQRLVKQLGVRKNPFKIANFLAQHVPIKFDFHNVAPEKLVRWIRDLPAPSAGDLDVVVLIGHTKEHIDDRGFETLVRGVKDAGMSIISLNDVAALLPPLSGTTGAPPVPADALVR